MQEKERSAKANLSYGRYLNLGLNPSLLEGKAKLDFTVSYEDVLNDPIRQDRTLAVLSFSQGVANGFSLSASLVWANKPEYRGNVDEEFSANLGLNYKFGKQGK